MSEMHEAYKRRLVENLVELNNDRERVKAVGVDWEMTRLVGDGMPDTLAVRSLARARAAERVADLDYRIAQLRLSIDLAETAEKHRAFVRTALATHRDARALRLKLEQESRASV